VFGLPLAVGAPLLIAPHPILRYGRGAALRSYLWVLHPRRIAALPCVRRLRDGCGILLVRLRLWHPVTLRLQSASCFDTALVPAWPKDELSPN